MMRVFFALPLPEQLKLDIDQWRTHNMPPSQTTVPSANFHITLAFTGQIRDSDIEVLCARTDDLIKSAEFKAGSLKLIDTGFWAKPGILWIGPEIWPDNLTKLAHKLQNVGRNFGAKKDKKAYRPHLTLSKRIQTSTHPTTPPNFHLDYDQVTLYQSISMKSGVRYMKIQSWPLA
ncbi:MAG: 2'-5' RNA ligase [Pseudohongiellaceae bacterium]|jgi:2'-5' RNA ligase